MIWPLLKFLGKKLSNFFVGILVETMTAKGHFELNFRQYKFIFADLFGFDFLFYPAKGWTTT